jgi:WD40 repeat protein
VSGCADTAYAALDDAGRGTVRRTFPRLVRIGDDTVDTSQAVDRTALLDGLPDPRAAERALNVFAASRLLVLDQDTVRFSHDALLRAWPLLRQWVDADRDWLRMRQQLVSDADAWWRSGQDPSLLYRGSRLAAARAGAAEASRSDIDTDPRLASFLAASRRAEQRGARRRTAVIATLVVLCLLAVGGGVLALVYQGRAATQRDHAVARPASVLTGAPIGQDRSAVPLRRVAFRPDGEVLAAPGDGNNDGVRLWQVHDLKHPTLLSKNTDSVDTCRDALVSTAFSPDGTLLATACKDHLFLWEVDRPRHIQQVNDLHEPEPERGPGGSPDGGTAIFGPRGSQLLHATANGIHLWNVANAPQIGAAATLGGAPSGFGVAMRFSGGPRRLLVVEGASDGALWDMTGPPPHHKLTDLPGSGNLTGSAAAFSPDGSVLATNEEDHGRSVLRLRDTRHPHSAPLATVSDFANGVNALAYSADGKVLAASDNSGTTQNAVPPRVRLFDVSRPSEPRQVAVLPADVLHLAFTPHGRLLTGNGADTLLLWNVDDPRHPAIQPPRRLTPGSGVSDSAFRPDGKLIAVTDAADTTRLWRVDHDHLVDPPTVIRTVGSGSGVDFAPDGRTLAWTSTSGSKETATGDVKDHIELWDVSDPGMPVFRAAFAYDGVSIGGGEISFSTQGTPLLADTNGAVNVWNTDPEAAVKLLCDSIGDVIPEPQWRKYVPDTAYHPPCPAT